MRLSWRLAVPPDLREFGGLVPFLIDWGDSPHPAATVTRGLRLVSFTGFHPDVAKVEQRLAINRTQRGHHRAGGTRAGVEGGTSNTGR